MANFPNEITRVRVKEGDVLSGPIPFSIIAENVKVEYVDENNGKQRVPLNEALFVNVVTKEDIAALFKKGE